MFLYSKLQFGYPEPNFPTNKSVWPLQPAQCLKKKKITCQYLNILRFLIKVWIPASLRKRKLRIFGKLGPQHSHVGLTGSTLDSSNLDKQHVPSPTHPSPQYCRLYPQLKAGHWLPRIDAYVLLERGKNEDTRVPCPRHSFISQAGPRRHLRM